MRVVARDGLDAVTFRSVAAEAGVTHGLASYHFRNRETMLQEALRWATRRGIERSSIDSAVDDVDRFAARLAALVQADPDGQSFQQQAHYWAGRRPALRPEVEQLRAAYLETVRGSLRRLEVGDDEALARLVLAALDGLVFQQLFFDDPDVTEAAVGRLQDVLRLVRRHGLPDAPAGRTDG